MAILDRFRRKRKKDIKKRSAFQGAQTGSHFADFLSSSNSANAEIRPNLEILRNRCRSLSRNNDYAKRYLNLLVTNIVGHNGIRYQSKARGNDGKLDALNNDLEKRFTKWSKKEYCTMSGTMSFREAQAVMIESLARDGEILVEFCPSDNEFGFGIKLIEADHLDHNYNAKLDNGNTVYMGIEFDEYSKPINYHVFKNHPHEDATFKNRKRIRRIIPATDLLHIYMKDRPSQVRGYPLMSSVVERLHNLDSFEHSAVINAKISASKMGFFTMPQGGDDYVGEEYENEFQPVMDATPGSFETLPEGYDIRTVDWQYPNTNFESFHKQVLRGIASGLNVDYVSLANDLTGVSYSSIRQGTMAERDHYKVLQAFMVEHFITPVFERWLKSLMLQDNDFLDYRDDRFDKFSDSATWIPRAFHYVDPQREIQANINALNNGLITMQDVQNTYGRDLEEVFDQIDREKQLAKDKGIETAFEPFGAKSPVSPLINGENNDDEK
jgi:lambda family phage portal protein